MGPAGHINQSLKTLNRRSRVVGLYRRLRGNIIQAQAGADDIQPVQTRLGGNLLFIAAPTEVLVRDAEVKVLLHFPAVDVAPDAVGNIGFAPERPRADLSRNLVQQVFGAP